MRQRTKIIATIGPSCSKKGIIQELLNIGVNCFRINLSHGSVEEKSALFSLIKSTKTPSGLRPTILADLSGPKINKFKLLNIIKKIYNKDIDILEENQFRIDRSLNSNKFIKLTKYKKKSWKKMFLEYKKFHDKQFI